MMEYLWLFLGGLLIGAIGVVFGGSAFLAIPLMQSLFPAFSFGDVLGNVRAGSLARSLASTTSTRKHIDLKKALFVLVPFALSSVVGLLVVANLAQNYLLYAIVLAIVFSELSPKAAHLINKKTRFFFSILLGLYQGIVGAGSSIMLVALLRTVYPRKDQIVFLKIQARFIEMAGVILLVTVHVFKGNIVFPVWFFYALGAGIGGFFGGHFLAKTTKISSKVQHWYLIVVYMVALLPFVVKYLF